MVLLIQFLTGIAWPVTIIWVAYLFKGELRGLLNRISHLRYKDVEVKLELDEAEAEAKTVEQTISFSLRSSSDIDSKLVQLRRIAEVSPRAAIMEAWI
jgi:hypothetical protein